MLANSTCGQRKCYKTLDSCPFFSCYRYVVVLAATKKIKVSLLLRLEISAALHFTQKKVAKVMGEVCVKFEETMADFEVLNVN